jgi:UDP-N-acetylglucosamine 4,6-dehydratase
MKNFYKNKIIAITGGTGSFGSMYLRSILKYPIKELRILSRDEEKQNILRYIYTNKKIKFILCDVRDYKNLEFNLRNVDYVIHAAALKQVPSCEFFPEEAIKTNTLGTLNVANACIANNVKKAVLLSTDKAVYPINTMGMSKALGEKIFLSKSEANKRTEFVIIRYGNVIASRGSIVPRFIDQAISAKQLTVTNKTMSRFAMSLENAFNLLEHALFFGKSGMTIIQKSKSLNIIDLAKAIIKIFNKNKNNIKFIGIRHGEKLDEVLASEEEMSRSIDKKKFIYIPKDSRNLNYEKYFDNGKKLKVTNAYRSGTEEKLSINSIIKMLLKEPVVKKNLK